MKAGCRPFAYPYRLARYRVSPEKDLNSPEEVAFTLSVDGSRVLFEFGRFRILPQRREGCASFGRGLAAPKEVIIPTRKRIREPSTAAFRISVFLAPVLGELDIGGSLNRMTVAVWICCPSANFNGKLGTRVATPSVSKMLPKSDPA
jgi:hypothetical protein